MDKCPITELDSERVDNTSYRIKFNDEYLFVRHGIRFDALLSDENFIKNRYIIAGAILNKQLSDRSDGDVYWFTITLDNLEKKLKDIIYPKTPKDKMDNLFKTLYKLQKYDGDDVEVSKTVSNPGFWYKHFFKSRSECFFYIRSIDYLEIIKGQFQEGTGLPLWYQFTFKGLNYYRDMLESGNLSNKCFVAMSFGNEMDSIRLAIKSAIETTGFDPIIIDEQHIDSDQTINDAIIAGLKSAKFCIADFTEQKRGVYFESGFALGQGKPVIYCCRNDHFDDTHFDTKHFAHLKYDTPSELNEMLINKINAWIK